MRGINKVILVGTLGRDPDVRAIPNGSRVATLSLATSDKDTSGQDRTEWHRVVMFGKLADVAAQYLRKGSQVYIEGQIRTNRWMDKNTNQERFSTEIVVGGYNGVMQMLGGSNSNNNYQNNNYQSNQQSQDYDYTNSYNNQDNAGQNNNYQANNTTNTNSSNHQANKTSSEPDYNDFDDDIPF